MIAYHLNKQKIIITAIERGNMTMSELIGWDDLISETEQNNYDRLINQGTKLLDKQQIFKQAFRYISMECWRNTNHLKQAFLGLITP